MRGRKTCGRRVEEDETAFEEVLDWLRQLDVRIPEPQPVALRWGPGGSDVIPVEMATDDDLVFTPDTPDLEDLAHAVISIVRDSQETFPNRRNWRRWMITRRLASFLYTSGICSNGGGLSMSGSDPHHTWVQTMPALNLYRRPYILFKQSWWWECHRAQGWRISGRHRPAEPFAFGLCARCFPCPECGAPYECGWDL